MNSRRQEKFNSLLRNLISAFLLKKTRDVFITINRVETFRSLKSAKIFITIFPESNEKDALDFLKGEAYDLREYIGSQIKTKFLPFLEFEIDKEEKARKRIDEILGQVSK